MRQPALIDVPAYLRLVCVEIRHERALGVQYERMSHEIGRRETGLAPRLRELWEVAGLGEAQDLLEEVRADRLRHGLLVIATITRREVAVEAPLAGESLEAARMLLEHAQQRRDPRVRHVEKICGRCANSLRSGRPWYPGPSLRRCP